MRILKSIENSDSFHFQMLNQITTKIMPRISTMKPIILKELANYEGQRLHFDFPDL